MRNQRSTCKGHFPSCCIELSPAAFVGLNVIVGWTIINLSFAIANPGSHPRVLNTGHFQGFTILRNNPFVSDSEELRKWNMSWDPWTVPPSSPRPWRFVRQDFFFLRKMVTASATKRAGFCPMWAV